MKSLLLFLALPLLLPHPAQAGCNLSMRCVAASRASAPPKYFEDEGACRRTAASANSQYPGCTYTCTCSASGSGSRSSGGGGYGAGGFDPGQELLLQGSYALGQAIGAALFGGGRDSGAEAAERERRRQRIEEEERLEREREEERRRRFEADKEDLLKEVKGASASPAMDFKGAGTAGSGGDAPELSFKEYHDRESERRTVLEKLARDAARDAVSRLEKAIIDWCKLHPVLYPSRSGATDDESFQWRLRDYNARHQAWKDYCEQDFTKVRAAALAAAPKEGFTPRADCLGAFQKETDACSGHSQLVAHMDCINRAIKSWHDCPGEPPVPLGESPSPTPAPLKTP